MIRDRIDYYDHGDGEDDHDNWYEIYADPEQDEDVGDNLGALWRGLGGGWSSGC